MRPSRRSESRRVSFRNLRVSRNIQAEIGPKNVAIALVAIGPGVGMLTADSLAANSVQDALATGVSVATAGYVEL
jgi:intracellular sulfur oxidation DsrE/DsrF family protein